MPPEEKRDAEDELSQDQLRKLQRHFSDDDDLRSDQRGEVDPEIRMNQKKEKNKRKQTERDIEALNLMAQAEAKKSEVTPVLESQAPKETEGRYLWYPEIGKHLVDATKSMAKDEDKVVFGETKKTALMELVKRIPEINKIINEFRFQIYWAGKVLNGFGGPTPFGDSIKAMNFLRDTLNIDKNGADNLKEELSEKLEKKELGNEKKTEEMNFEDKMKMVDKADYGGGLFPAFKKYINGESIPVGFDIENVLSQIGKLFPFDVKKFAGEMRSRRENAEKPVVEWEGKYKDEQLFQTLKKVVKEDLWQKKMEELSVLDEVTRDNELMILMALIKIKSEGMTTVEAWRLWNSQNSKLEELGLML